MKIVIQKKAREAGKIGKILILWLLGVPLGIAILGVYLAGCR